MKMVIVILAAIALTGSLVAQERTAGGSIDIQMTWSALKNLVEAANTKSDAVNNRVDQVAKCGVKGMLYGPGAGADGDGCRNISDTNRFGGFYTLGAGNNTCRLANPFTGNCSCPSGYKGTQIYDFVDTQWKRYYSNSGYSVLMVQCYK